MFPALELCLQIYVDDPHVSLKGTEAERSRTLTILLLWWRALGIQMNWRKTRRGRALSWIGATIEIMPHRSVKVGVPAKMAAELAEEAGSFLGLKSVELRAMRRFTGRSS